MRRPLPRSTGVGGARKVGGVDVRAAAGQARTTHVRRVLGARRSALPSHNGANGHHDAVNPTAAQTT